jgi:uncharacterized protein YjiS (DUF1127 family)
MDPDAVRNGPLARTRLTAIWRRWRAMGELRAAAARLERMSDADLRDIGIIRDDIRRCVRQGRCD